MITYDSDLSRPDRKFYIVTTAALPWRTGTSVNPLLRALYLSRGRPEKCVCLVIPWLEDKGDRNTLYGGAFNDGCSSDPGDGRENQEKWIRNFASKECGMPEEANAIEILFYRAAYLQSFGSIFATEDICGLVPREDADVAILEEPEHLNWFRLPASAVNLRSEAARETGKGSAEEASNDLHSTSQVNMTVDVSREERNTLDSQLGWARKFRFVVGICHTNYAAYVKQYGIGASIIAAPVIVAFNSLVVRAYCHRVIKLSGVLQSFAPEKEVICNVHGVRPDFLSSSKEENRSNQGEPSTGTIVYFVGKLLWAKGLDHLLDIQDRYRKRTGSFFPINIYGGGPDEKAITRAFYGRMSPTPDRVEMDVSEQNGKPRVPMPVEPVFQNPLSLRTQSIALLERGDWTQHNAEHDDSARFKSLGFEVTDTCSLPDSIEYVVEKAGNTDGCGQCDSSPLSIIGDASVTSISTGIATSVAAYKIGDAAVKNILSLVFSPDECLGDAKEKVKSMYVFDPPQSRFELRRHPVPANFLGVMDHALTKHMPLRIFLNPSVSEVLCTTTAEALAMGKFVIIPRHPSNMFFEQFPNALMYDTLDDAVDQLIFAMKNMPDPLCEESSRLLSWEAATERLIMASAVTSDEDMERKIKQVDKSDEHIAWLHSEASRTTHFLSSIFHQAGRRETG
mmetsp:Transcript_13537/g.29396  ORF Transcript_13537/g.29396 Transcript_13537/m.29396 type:complete len:679 (+) Transcript_13537:220-2256(+)|eukprot:CAMPEP_0178482696 /NCGR_PEP_ID=MMETSP0696-20121128/6859_1 /TAXON_ID=265572 /ORGANISM="Extubocellulus spinifer, Strain CCMP396" /LENGTH=678 /DNA_ID=CAMNT_0020110205 /DNA_START=173 /DNA_END=2209 /DNA_ORIENTATION=-